ncbi:hypothetical protein D3C77_361890 [compost metagenome]
MSPPEKVVAFSMASAMSFSWSRLKPAASPVERSTAASWACSFSAAWVSAMNAVKIAPTESPAKAPAATSPSASQASAATSADSAIALPDLRAAASALSIGPVNPPILAMRSSVSVPSVEAMGYPSITMLMDGLKPSLPSLLQGSFQAQTHAA